MGRSWAKTEDKAACERSELPLVAACRLFSCGAWASLPRGMWDLSSLTKDRTHVLCIRRQILNHWTTREFSGMSFLTLGICKQRRDASKGRALERLVGGNRGKA